ncbi:MAG TPA: glycosyl hydrolase family 28-related protein, partial [Candidatus Angelobacter sp.]|nr:glycosyl hydrolase family 28-related protein [Candidatus Angelobacter sp.]
MAAIDPLPMVINLPANVSGLQIQKALDVLPAAGGAVYLPAGEFTITQPIILKRDNQTLRGAGETTILRLAADANCPVIILGEPVNRPKHTVKNLCVADLLIDGNRFQQSRELWHLSGEGSEIRNNGITIQRVSGSLVQDITCSRCRSGGLVTTLEVRDLTVRKLTAFDNEFDGMACYETRHSTFTDLYL